MKLIFSNRNTVSSFIIRLFTWSKWSHVDVVIDEDLVIGAYPGIGVAYENYEQTLRAAYKFEILEIESSPQALEFVKAQVGAKYDYIGIVGLELNRNWQEPSAWFCSELAATALQTSGTILFRDNHLFRVTPGLLYSRILERQK